MVKYCFCYSLEVAVTLIGFLHLNAALFFWARFSTFEPIYMWVDIFVAACYTLRATFFFLMLADDASLKSRVDYYDWNLYTAYGLGACGAAICTLKWLEWGHPPVWSLVSWTLVGLFNWYHWVYLNDYAKLPATASSKIELTEKDGDDSEESEEEDSAFDEDERRQVNRKKEVQQLLIVNKME